MKLEAGKWCRTKEGTIFKIIGGNVDMWEIDIDYSYLSKCENEDYNSYAYNKNNSLFEDLVVKASYNIIDILEKGDYVNGSKILGFENEYIKEDDKFVPFGIITENCYLNNNSWFTEKDIKSIVTKEQFESMKYEVGE